MSYFPNRATYINRMVTFYENISVGDEVEEENAEVIKQLKILTSHDGNKFRRSSLSPNSKRALSTSISPPSNNQGRNVEKKLRKTERKRSHFVK